MPFSSVEDVINRLLPYHIYQYPEGDLETNISTEEKLGNSHDRDGITKGIKIIKIDDTMIEIFKCQVEMFEKHNKINEKVK